MKAGFLNDLRGSTAVEFALVAPVLFLFMLGIAAFAIVFSIASGVQQLASESARASVAGLSGSERQQIVRDFITAHVGAYPFVLPGQLTIDAASLDSPSASFQVSLTYDLTRQVAATFGALIPASAMQLRRSAVVLVSSGL